MFVISELAEMNHHPHFAEMWAICGAFVMVIALIRKLPR